MTKYERLKKEAKQSAEGFRGHKLGNFQIHKFMRSGGHNRVRSQAICKVCGKFVTIVTHPLPNEIEIGGNALAFGCDDPPTIKGQEGPK